MKRSRLRERPSFRFVKSNPFVDRLAKLLVNRGLVLTVHAAKHQSGTTSNVALVLFIPSHNFTYRSDVFFTV
jgi:hypothetical protein